MGYFSPAQQSWYLSTFHIHINGIVQGVGFRPMVYQLAKAWDLRGIVSNGVDGLHIHINADKMIAERLLDHLLKLAPANSQIVSSSVHQEADLHFDDFQIVTGDDPKAVKQVLVMPDVALCEKCRGELLDTHNRRYRYPFITCTQCGPRYSIIQSLPYERFNTAMQPFDQCTNCSEEYFDTSDRRFFSQTNSCNDCGIQLSVWKKEELICENDNEKILRIIQEALHKGAIIALKGVGGYLLLCDAMNVLAIETLRRRKHRPAKPFALLYPGIKTIENDFIVSKRERSSLLDATAPIVLLRPKLQTAFPIAKDQLAPGLLRLGVMMPYSPLLQLVANDFGRPLVATSANFSGSPIIYRDSDALLYLPEIADVVVSFNREIVAPQDDSVLYYSGRGQKIILRRSRGLAPNMLAYKPVSNSTILAMGAHLKSSFSLAVNSKLFISQFLGNGEVYESQQMYQHTVQHFLKLYGAKPDVILADLHQEYFTHQYAKQLAGQYGSNLQIVQHHAAHFAAVMAENNLQDLQEPVMGICWDGTGLGTDGNIWGSEFFVQSQKNINRFCHFEYFPIIAGDKMAHEPRLSALSLLHNTEEAGYLLQRKFTDSEWKNYHALIASAGIQTSSAGRVFDAVACLLGLCDKQTYEGEAAMYLQALAENYLAEHKETCQIEPYEVRVGVDHPINMTAILRKIADDILRKKEKGFIANRFISTLANIIQEVIVQSHIKHVCFSGGVFQNSLLVDRVAESCASHATLYFHRHLSPNDENISFGQLVYFENKMTFNTHEKGLMQISNNKQNHLHVV